MPVRKTIDRARKAKRAGKAPSTQAGAFIREEMHHVRGGKHGARSTRQAIAIGLSKARRAGVELPPPKEGKASAATRRKATQDSARGADSSHTATSAKRSQATLRALRREGGKAASSENISRQSKTAASKRSRAERSASARKAARTKGPAQRSAAAKRAAHTREMHA